MKFFFPLTFTRLESESKINNKKNEGEENVMNLKDEINIENISIASKPQTINGQMTTRWEHLGENDESHNTP